MTQLKHHRHAIIVWGGVPSAAAGFMRLCRSVRSVRSFLFCCPLVVWDDEQVFILLYTEIHR